MMFRKIISLIFIYASIAFFIPEFSSAQESGINSGDLGIHLRASYGAGSVAWGYIDSGSNRGDLGSGDSSSYNLAAMIGYSLVGFEFNYMGGDIEDLEWTDDSTGTKVDYKSTGSGNYNEYDWKLGARLFTEPGDMGYTFIYMGKRYWNTERKQDTQEADGISNPFFSDIKYKAKGDGWIYGIRDFSTIDISDTMGIVIQSGLFLGTAPVTSFKVDGTKTDLPSDKTPFSLGAELGVGVSFNEIGLSVIGGVRGEFNLTVYDDSTDPSQDESVFGFGNRIYFLEVGMMF